jgi:hypothetical protein
MFKYDPNPTMSEAEFMDCLEAALERLVISDWTPWADLTDALENIASAEDPVPEALIERAHAIYLSHTTPITKSAETGELSTTHRPLGTHGLWGDRTAQLPAYIQNIAHSLMRDGHSESEAIELAIGAVRRWAAGGKHVTPEVRAAAASALAEWEKLKAEHNKSEKLFHPDQLRDSHGRWARTTDDVVNVGGEPVRIIGAHEARGNSRAVSREEFARIASDGKRILAGMRERATPPKGLTDNLDTLKAFTRHEVLKSWGGATIDAHSGHPLASDANKWAVTVKPVGVDSVKIHENPTPAEWSAAMDEAVQRFGGVLANDQHYLGVFHDDDEGRIDIDPVVVVDSLEDSEAIGAYTHNIGGAYNFADGNGYWPPHVADTTKVMKGMAEEETKTEFRGIGEWYAQNRRLNEQADEED